MPVLASTLVFAEAADAYKLGGKRWPGKPTARIGYHNSAEEYRWAVNEAIRAWNNSGMPIGSAKPGLLLKRDEPHSRQNHFSRPASGFMYWGSRARGR